MANILAIRCPGVPGSASADRSRQPRAVDDSVMVIKLADVGFDAADEVAELADLFLARGDLVLGPLLQVGRGTRPLPVGQ